jgi:hypothetical protein
MAYTTDQLDAFWSRYVTMREVDVISLTHPDSAAYEPAFARMLAHVMQNQLYVFSHYGGPCAGPSNGNNKYIGRFGGG